MIEASTQPFRGADIDAWLSPAATSELLASAAGEILKQTDDVNAQALGGEASAATTVDGSQTSDLSRVKPGGTIARKYDVMPAVLAQIGDWIWQHSPVRTGRYQRSHRLLADGSEIAAVTSADWTLPAQLPEAKQFAFVPTTSYAPDIEPHDGKPGESRQAPDGVYQVIAALAQDSYAALAAFAFTLLDGEPAIVITPH